jgi:phosphoadenosine phosphosulfate reductase
MSISKITDELTAIEAGFRADDVHGLVAWAVERHGPRLTLALNLGIEDTVLLHLLDEVASQAVAKPRVFTLDTGRLPSESYEQLERLRDRYRLPIEVYFPEHAAVETLYREKGPFSFYESVEARKACCAIRKVDPLSRALAGTDAWLTGLRRAQGPTRADVARLEQEGKRLKVSPLAHLSDDDIWKLATELDVPVHPLHRRDYRSIGCAPCTRAVKPGEASRSGRWWWEDPTLAECGIHERGR